MMKPMLGLSLHVSMPTCVHDAGWDWASVEAAVNPPNEQTTSVACINARTRVTMTSSLFALGCSSAHPRMAVRGKSNRDFPNLPSRNYLTYRARLCRKRHRVGIGDQRRHAEPNLALSQI